MAEDFQDYRAWLKDQHPYPNFDENEILSGHRSKAWLPCQYWVGGMPAVCKHWVEGDPGKCGKFDFLSPCDYLGRQASCAYYEKLGKDNTPDEYMCIAPNVMLSGLITIEEIDKKGIVTKIKVAKKSEIIGYNDGKCDGQGLGRYPGSSSGSFSDLLKKRPRCNYYRPWQMGFGSIEPHKIVYSSTAGIIDEKGSYALVAIPMLRRLPIQLRMLNSRAVANKCQYWDRAYGAKFLLKSDSTVDIDDTSVFGTGTTSTACVATDPAARDYADRLDPTAGDVVGTMNSNIWAKKDDASFVCNGAKPECPCYTGEWHYCIDEKAREGSPITAEQILELRFWEYDWATEKEYKDHYKNIHNKSDLNITDADIYTFTNWKITGPTVATSIMEGKKVSLCQPIPAVGKRFIPDKHVKKVQITYAPAGVHSGTPHKSKSLSATFPTLMRALDEFDTRPFHIMYPYVNKDFVTSSTIDCETTAQKIPFIKKTNSTSTDHIMVFGSSVRGIYMYAFNLLSITDTPSEFTTYNNGIEVPSDKQVAFYENVLVWIEREENNANSKLFKSIADPGDGYFAIGPIELEQQKLNPLIIIADYGDGVVDFKKRNVWAQWYGGVTVQTEFKQEYGDGYYVVAEPSSFTPGGEVTAQGVTMHGNNSYSLSSKVDRAFSVHSHITETLFSTTTHYSYCYKEKTVTKDSVEVWGDLQGTNKVWVVINDIKLNYVFNWVVDEVKMVPKAGVTLCGEEVAEVKMSVIYPTSAERSHVDPNVFLCTPKDSELKIWFRSDEWDVYVKYTYTYMSNDNSTSSTDVISWPTFSDSIVFSEVAHSFEVLGSQIKVEDILTNTVKAMTDFTDEDGRLMSCFATKLCVGVGVVACRSVEISYGYIGDTKIFNLLPDAGFALITDRLTQEITGSGRTSSSPPCGDHDGGFMWYPFSSCEKFLEYDQWSGAAFCTKYIEGKIDKDTGKPSPDPTRYDYRFMGPTKYEAWASERGLWLAACSPAWNFWYSECDGASGFTGSANIRSGQLSLYYAIRGESPPPFGDATRESVERWISQDHRGYLAQGRTKKIQWMPMMMDDTSFFMSFNAFDGSSRLDPFGFVNQMSFYIGDVMSEEAPEENTRLNFEELFEVVPRGLSSYPEPLVYRHDRGSAAYVHYYVFKEDGIVWAWQENWKDIERVPKNRMYFVELEKPPYVFSLYKEEHRLITDEGFHDIKFTPPEYEEGKLIKYPSIALGDGSPRYFGIEYDDYDVDTGVEWKDESPGGVVDGSGGGEGIYEKTSDSSKWFAWPNSILDDNAVSDVDDSENEMVLAYDPDLDLLVKPNYNRGLIANISRVALKNLPYKINASTSINSTSATISQNFSGAGFGTMFKGNMIAEFELGSSTPGVIKVEFTGKWGISLDTISIPNKYIRISKPSFNIVITYESGETFVKSTTSVSAVSTFVANEQKIEDYTITISFPATPKYLAKEEVKSISVSAGASGSEYASIDGSGNSITMKLTTARYEEMIETVHVWERKYLVSKGATPVYNLNGPGKVLMPGQDMENAGQYFPKRGESSTINDARSKIHQFSATKEYPDMISIDINLGNILQVEREEQKKLWDGAIDVDPETYGSQRFSIYIPPVIRSFMQKVSVVSSFPSSALFSKGLCPFDNHYLKMDYDEDGVLWYPGGHKWIWSEKWREEKCWFVGPIERAADAQFEHVSHADGLLVDVVNPLKSLYFLRGAYIISKVVNTHPKYAGAAGSGLHSESYG